MKVLEERRQLATRIGDDEMHVRRHRTEAVYEDAHREQIHAP